MKYTLIGLIIYAALFLIIWILRPTSGLHAIQVLRPDDLFRPTKKNRIIIAAVCLATVLVAILPMGISPFWNGSKESNQTHQYEEMAESLLHGHLYLELEASDELLALDNPYDPYLRADIAGLERNVDYHWDHAFYKGRYYMYFGVVPVILLFLPFRLITGTALTTYHATQIFTAFYIVGVFSLLLLLIKRFYRKISLLLYLLMSMAISFMSTWYIIMAPALYCTAISSGLCMEIWSLYFFIKAVYDAPSENKEILFAFFGSLFGALCFGCRPPIALANIIVIPLLVVYIKDRGINVKRLLKLILAALPYIVIGVLLMWYNYARFDNPLEFGQAYQLTEADQTQYVNMLSRIKLSKIWEAFIRLYCNLPNAEINTTGMYFAFPLTVLALLTPLFKGTRTKLKGDRLIGIVGGIFVSIFAMLAFITAGSPRINVRYVMDVAWITGLVSFILLASWLTSMSDNESSGTGSGSIAVPAKAGLTKTGIANFLVCLLCLEAIIMSFVLFWYPYDYNISTYIWGVIKDAVIHIFTLGLC